MENGCIMCCKSFPNEMGEGDAPSFQHPLGIGAAQFLRQAASGYAPAPVLRTKPSESLPHCENVEPSVRIVPGTKLPTRCPLNDAKTQVGTGNFISGKEAILCQARICVSFVDFEFLVPGTVSSLQNERYQYPRASPGKRRLRLLFRPKGRGISPCFPGTRSGMEPPYCFLSSRFVGE